MLDYTFEKAKATVYKVRPKDGEKYRTWADVSIHEWKGGGSISIISDYGNYSHGWNAIGERPFRKFLCGLDMDYFGKKTLPQGYLQDDVEASQKAAMVAVVEYRRENPKSLDKETARDLYDGIAQADTCGDDMGYFAAKIQDLDGFDLVFGHGMDFPYRKQYNPQLKGFWEILWPCLVDIWQKELSEIPCPKCGYDLGKQMPQTARLEGGETLLKDPQLCEKCKEPFDFDMIMRGC